MKRMKLLKKSKPDMRVYEADGYFAGWFFDEVYRANVNVLWNVDGLKVKKFLKERYDHDHDGDDEWGGKCIELFTADGRSLVVICLRKWDSTEYDIGVLVHECWHATEAILGARSIKHSEETTEPFAYLLQSIVTRCLRLLSLKP